ncbi:MAG: adenylyltransferase/cytidyltransferase family protein [Candidatus Moranbacteria bacterium]|nr:adenylyltransferase/cytidyltransferase family protein [Candidatus Moranbacteria bacterium]
MQNNKIADHGVYVGRFNPIHLGHEAVIAKMLERFGVKNSLLILGSSTAPFSQRHFFSYSERIAFIKTIFPQLEIADLPDFPTDEQWLSELDKILLAKNFDPANTVFFGGYEQDLIWFLEAGRQCEILNRFDGTTPIISATQVRELLASNEPTENLLNPIINNKVRKIFTKKQIGQNQKNLL